MFLLNMEMDTDVNRSDQLGKLLKTVYESNFEKWLSVTLYELHEHPIILPLLNWSMVSVMNKSGPNMNQNSKNGKFHRVTKIL